MTAPIDAQAAFDLDDAQQRLARLRAVMRERDTLDDGIRKAKNELARLRRRRIEVGWELDHCLRVERQHGRSNPPQPIHQDDGKPPAQAKRKGKGKDASNGRE